MDFTPEVIISDNVADLYQRAIFNVFRGKIVSPRGRETYEMANAGLVLTNLRNNVLISPVRDLNYRFLVAEWLWILFGRDDVASISRYNSNIAQFSDDGVRFEGAYGPRIGRQIPYLIQKFRDDPSTREGVITIFSPSPAPSRDIPCTVSMQFLQREGKLNCIATMRSSDAWWGLIHDIYVFSQMTNYFAFLLGYDTGWLAMNLGSSHLYQQHWAIAAEFMGSNPKWVPSPRLQIHAPNLLNHILHGEDCGDDALIHDAAFRGYGNILCCKTKAQAQKILEEISPL